MSDIVVQPLATGWTVRHERILFERFKDKEAALHRARHLRLRLQAGGEGPTLRVLDPRAVGRLA